MDGRAWVAALHRAVMRSQRVHGRQDDPDLSDETPAPKRSSPPRGVAALPKTGTGSQRRAVTKQTNTNTATAATTTTTTTVGAASATGLLSGSSVGHVATSTHSPGAHGRASSFHTGSIFVESLKGCVAESVAANCNKIFADGLARQQEQLGIMTKAINTFATSWERLVDAISLRAKSLRDRTEAAEVEMVNLREQQGTVLKETVEMCQRIVTSAGAPTASVEAACRLAFLEVRDYGDISVVESDGLRRDVWG